MNWSLITHFREFVPVISISFCDKAPTDVSDWPKVLHLRSMSTQILDVNGFFLRCIKKKNYTYIIISLYFDCFCRHTNLRDYNFKQWYFSFCSTILLWAQLLLYPLFVIFNKEPLVAVLKILGWAKHGSALRSVREIIVPCSWIFLGLKTWTWWDIWRLASEWMSLAVLFASVRPMRWCNIWW